MYLHPYFLHFSYLTRITNTESNVDTLQSKMSAAQSDITALTTRITAEQSNVDTLQHKTQLLTSTADTATSSGKVSWGIDKFICIKAREEVSISNSATLTKVID